MNDAGPRLCVVGCVYLSAFDVVGDELDDCWWNVVCADFVDKCVYSRMSTESNALDKAMYVLGM